MKSSIETTGAVINNVKSTDIQNDFTANIKFIQDSVKGTDIFSGFTTADIKSVFSNVKSTDIQNDFTTISNDLNYLKHIESTDEYKSLADKIEAHYLDPIKERYTNRKTLIAQDKNKDGTLKHLNNQKAVSRITDRASYNKMMAQRTLERKWQHKLHGRGVVSDSYYNNLIHRFDNRIKHEETHAKYSIRRIYQSKYNKDLIKLRKSLHSNTLYDKVKTDIYKRKQHEQEIKEADKANSAYTELVNSININKFIDSSSAAEQEYRTPYEWENYKYNISLNGENIDTTDLLSKDTEQLLTDKLFNDLDLSKKLTSLNNLIKKANGESKLSLTDVTKEIKLKIKDQAKALTDKLAKDIKIDEKSQYTSSLLNFDGKHTEKYTNSTSQLKVVNDNIDKGLLKLDDLSHFYDAVKTQYYHTQSIGEKNKVYDNTFIDKYTSLHTKAVLKTIADKHMSKTDALDFIKHDASTFYSNLLEKVHIKSVDKIESDASGRAYIYGAKTRDTRDVHYEANENELDNGITQQYITKKVTESTITQYKVKHITGTEVFINGNKVDGEYKATLEYDNDKYQSKSTKTTTTTKVLGEFHTEKVKDVAKETADRLKRKDIFASKDIINKAVNTKRKSKMWEKIKKTVNEGNNLDKIRNERFQKIQSMLLKNTYSKVQQDNLMKYVNGYTDKDIDNKLNSLFTTEYDNEKTDTEKYKEAHTKKSKKWYQKDVFDWLDDANDVIQKGGKAVVKSAVNITNKTYYAATHPRETYHKAEKVVEKAYSDTETWAENSYDAAKDLGDAVREEAKDIAEHPLSNLQDYVQLSMDTAVVIADATVGTAATVVKTVGTIVDDTARGKSASDITHDVGDDWTSFAHKTSKDVNKVGDDLKTTGLQDIVDAGVKFAVAVGNPACAVLQPHFASNSFEPYTLKVDSIALQNKMQTLSMYMQGGFQPLHHSSEDTSHMAGSYNYDNYIAGGDRFHVLTPINKGINESVNIKTLEPELSKQLLDQNDYWNSHNGTNIAEKSHIKGDVTANFAKAAKKSQAADTINKKINELIGDSKDTPKDNNDNITNKNTTKVVNNVPDNINHTTANSIISDINTDIKSLNDHQKALVDFMNDKHMCGAVGNKANDYLSKMSADYEKLTGTKDYFKDAGMAAAYKITGDIVTIASAAGSIVTGNQAIAYAGSVGAGILYNKAGNMTRGLLNTDISGGEIKKLQDKLEMIKKEKEKLTKDL